MYGNDFYRNLARTSINYGVPAVAAGLVQGYNYIKPYVKPILGMARDAYFAKRLYNSFSPSQYHPHSNMGVKTIPLYRKRNRRYRKFKKYYRKH